MTYPRSPFDKVGGLVYVPRMLDKIRLQAQGRLPEAYHPQLGEGMDGRCCGFLRVSYADVVARVQEGLGDEAVLAWCCQHGRTPDELDIQLWNGFMTKRGWHDEDPSVGETLQSFKESAGLGDRNDIQTFFDYFEVDEKRRP